jgi:hypothetical protein
MFRLSDYLNDGPGSPQEADLDLELRDREHNSTHDRDQGGCSPAVSYLPKTFLSEEANSAVCCQSSLGLAVVHNASSSAAEALASAAAAVVATSATSGCTAIASMAAPIAAGGRLVGVKWRRADLTRERQVERRRGDYCVRWKPATRTDGGLLACTTW